MKKLICLCLFVSMVSHASRVPVPKKRSTAKKPSPSRQLASVDADLPQKIFAAENLRISHSPDILAGLRHPSAAVVRSALLAIGRIGDPSGLDQIERILSRPMKEQNKELKELKKTALFALSLISDPTAHKMLQQNTVLQKDPDILAATWESLGHTGNKNLLEKLGSNIKKATGETAVLNGQVLSVGHLFNTPGAEQWPIPEGLFEKLVQLTAKPEPIGLSASYALVRYPAPFSKEVTKSLLETLKRTPSDSGRALLCRTVGKSKSEESARALLEVLSHDTSLGVRIEATKALMGQPPSEALIKTLVDATQEKVTALVVQSLETMAPLTVDSKGIETIESLYRSHASQWVRETALKSLARLQPALARQHALEIVKGGTEVPLTAAARTLSMIGSDEDMPVILGFLSSQDLKVAAAAVEGLNPWSDKMFSDAILSTLRMDAMKGDVALTTQIAELAEGKSWTSFAPSLALIYPLLKSSEQVEARVAILNALKQIGNYSHVELLRTAMKDNERIVVEAAAKALTKITGVDEMKNVPLNSKITSPPPSLKEAKAALASKVVLNTSRGEIQIRFFPEAPATALNFVKLVKGTAGKPFYEGTPFHRLVPNFVAQGGDKRGDGYGGAGYFIRDEVSPKPHLPNTLGIATAGKDTGSSQFFFNLGPNLHLAGRYTLFAEVVKGMDVVEKLEAGDVILSATLK